MAQILQVKHKGLYTSPNEFSSVPEGALLRADGCIITVDNIIEPRRGQDRIATLPNSNDRFAKFEFFQDQQMAFWNTDKIGYKNGSTFTALSGTYSNPDDNLARKKFLLANSCLYFTTGAGVYKLDAYNGTPTLAGMYKGLDIELDLDGSSGFLAVDNAVAYRVVWGIRDAQNNLVLGAPSGRAIIVNPSTGTSRDVELTITIPSGITTSHFFQVYRSESSGGAAIEPDDELGLVYENNPSSGEISAGTLTFVDRTSDDLRGATIYTAVSQQGIANGNERPPQSDDMEEFEGSIVYANTKTKHRKTFTILGTTGTTGIAYGDTITIAGTTYTAAGTEDIATRKYAVYGTATITGDTNTSTSITNVSSSVPLRIGQTIAGTDIPAGTTVVSFTPTTITLSQAATGSTVGVTLTLTAGTPAQNIADTAASLVRVINRNSTNTTVYAYYLSGPNDLPGQILIEERGLGGSAFSLTASARGTAFNPVLPTSGTTVSSSNDDFANGLMFSKTEQGEAVPLINVRRVGSANSAIRRIKKLRNSLFIFKEREGIYRMTGTSPENFQIELFDSSAKLLAPESVAVVNNQIWCLCDQGITVVTETGVSVVSRPIENLILSLFGSSLNNVRYLSFGVGYETERQYILSTVTESADTVPTQSFVFSVFTQAYTIWPNSYLAGIVSPVDDRLYLGNGSTNHLLQERKARTYADYIDYGVSATIDSFNLTTVVLDSVSGVEVGDLLYQSDTVRSLILSIDVAFNEVVVEDTLTWTPGAATVYKAIPCSLEYAPITGGNPGSAKQFPELSMFFKEARFNNATVGFATDASPAFEHVPIAGSLLGTWGLGPWGSAPWGGTLTTKPIRTLVPLEKNRGSFLRVSFDHRQAYGYFKSLGFAAVVRDTGSTVIAK